MQDVWGHRLTVYYPVDFGIVRRNAPTILGLQKYVALGLISRIDRLTSAAGKLLS